MKAILLLGEDSDTCSTLQDVLRSEHYHVVVAPCWVVAARWLRKVHFALLVLDDPDLGERGEPQVPPDAAGAMPPILALSGHLHAAALRGGALLTKPFGLSEFLDAVRALARQPAPAHRPHRSP